MQLDPRIRRTGRALAAALLLSVFVIAAAGGSGALAEAEEYGRRLVEAVNSRDPAFRRETVRSVFSQATLAEVGEDRLVGLLERLATDLGTLELHHAEASAFKVGESARYAMHVFVRAASDGRWRDLQFFLEEAPPHRVKQIAFIANVAEPVYLPNGPVTDPQVIAWLNGYIDRLVEEEDLSGALLIARGDRPLLERYYGFADSARTVPCTARTRFNLGSGNKMFTALAIASLVEEGKLRFEATLDRFFPGHPDPAWAKTATVGHLISHTAGAREYWTAETGPALRHLARIRDVLPFVEAAGIAFAPGESVAYSNSNFILAGLVVESVTGRDYFEVVREKVLDPCGMVETDSYWMDGSTPDLAEPLTGEPHAWRRAPHGRRGTSAGGGFSTPQDILRFGRGLLAGKIVSPAMLSDMTRSHTAQIAGAQLDYGYGFIRETSADRVTSFGHGGFTAGVNFEYRYFPESDVTLIAFCNQDNGAYDSLRKTATRLITGER
jgi:CubicO group peptidase (beta-lactamase class C family)